MQAEADTVGYCWIEYVNNSENRVILTEIHIASGLQISVNYGARIIGGEDASNKSIPWQVSLVYYGEHHCGGSLINARNIITSANCVHSINIRLLKVRIGSKNRYSGGILVGVKNVTKHENFDLKTFNNDIAIIVLTTYVMFKKNVIEPIELPEFKSNVSEGILGMVSGWGLLSPGIPVYPETLQYAKIPIIGRQKCNELMNNLITDKMMCAGYPEGRIDVCHQDSGGPLVVYRKLVGIVSWGATCGKPGRPGVYTKVSEFTDWINKNLQ